MISNAVVPLDGSPAAELALPYAQAFLPDGGEVVLLAVVPRFDPLLTELLWSLEPERDIATDPEIETARKTLAEVVARVADTRLRWSIKVARGDPAEQILQAVERNSLGMIAMTTHGRRAIGRAMFGSVADRVSRASPVPVLLVRPALEEAPLPATEIRRLVAPLDGSALAEAALPLAIELARRLGIGIHLVRAINLAAVLAPLADGGVLTVPPPPEVYEQLSQSLQNDARNYLESTAARLAESRVTTTSAVLDGSPFFAIAEAAQPGDCIIMTSHGRGGVLRWLMGSVAEKLIREAPVPVLLVPSAGRGTRTGAG